MIAVLSLVFPMFHGALHDYGSNLKTFFYGFIKKKVMDQLKSCCVCVSVAEAPGAMKVTEWQQSYYGTDSGIQSGATTVRSDEDGTEYSTKKITYTTTFTENPAGKNIICCTSRLFYDVAVFPYQCNRLGQDPHYAIYFRLFPSKISRENAKTNG